MLNLIFQKTENLPFLEMREGKIFPTNWKIISFYSKDTEKLLVSKLNASGKISMLYLFEYGWKNFAEIISDWS